MSSVDPPDTERSTRFNAVVTENLRCGLYLSQRDALMAVARDLLYAPFPRADGNHLGSRFRARTWRWELVTQRPARVAGPVSITIRVGRPDRRRRDLDNASFKAVLDLLA